MAASILLAVYASNNKGFDVTAQVKAMIANGNDDVAVNNASFGDPDPGPTKYFLVWYTADGFNHGKPIGLAAVENQTVDLLPAPGYPSYYYNTSVQPPLPAASTTFEVKRAIYGSLKNGFDVTAICQAILNQGGVIAGKNATSFQIPINNNTFGGDPDHGNTKYFAMEYMANEAGPFFQGAKEGQLLTVEALSAGVLQHT